MTATKIKRRKATDEEREVARKLLEHYDRYLFGEKLNGTRAMKKLSEISGWDFAGTNLVLRSVASEATPFFTMSKYDIRGSSKASKFNYGGWAGMQTWVRDHTKEIDRERDTLKSVARRMNLAGRIANRAGVIEVLTSAGINLPLIPTCPPELKAKAEPLHDEHAGEKFRLVNRESGSGDQTPPKTARVTTTKAIEQYNEMHKKHPDFVILMRIGDFYETFGESAETLARVCGTTLTKRGDVKMSGVPCHSIEGHLKKLITAGHKAALAEQIDGWAA